MKLLLQLILLRDGLLVTDKELQRLLLIARLSKEFILSMGKLSILLKPTFKYLKLINPCGRLVNKLLEATSNFRLEGFGMVRDVNLLFEQSKVSNNGRPDRARFDTLQLLTERYFKLGKLSTTRSVNDVFPYIAICRSEGSPVMLSVVNLLYVQTNTCNWGKLFNGNVVNEHCPQSNCFSVGRLFRDKVESV